MISFIVASIKTENYIEFTMVKSAKNDRNDDNT